MLEKQTNYKDKIQEKTDIKRSIKSFAKIKILQASTIDRIALKRVPQICGGAV